ncbi:hypothetical protein [Rhodococcus jostii]|uniref:hypothetical protein n=1 Tax=Rhodococcus jostii TaxID=132919 RepID=UPI0002E95F54|nr:hypothetical protein [Rhodococcus jostii]
MTPDSSRSPITVAAAAVRGCGYELALVSPIASPDDLAGPTAVFCSLNTSSSVGRRRS